MSLIETSWKMQKASGRGKKVAYAGDGTTGPGHAGLPNRNHPYRLTRVGGLREHAPEKGKLVGTVYVMELFSLLSGLSDPSFGKGKLGIIQFAAWQQAGRPSSADTVEWGAVGIGISQNDASAQGLAPDRGGPYRCWRTLPESSVIRSMRTRTAKPVRSGSRSISALTVLPITSSRTGPDSWMVAVP